MHAIKAVVFGYEDVLNVPEDWNAWRTQRDRLAAGVQMTGEALWKYLFTGESWEQVIRGRIDEAAFWADRLQPLGLRDDKERRAFAAALFDGRMIHPVMRALLKQLHGHYRLAVLGNIEVREMATWLADTHALEGMFDVVIGSADVGLVKPEAAFYRLLLDRLACHPPEVLLIDSLPGDTAAAEALGMQTIRFESPQELVSALEARGMLPTHRVLKAAPLPDGLPSERGL